MRRHRALAVIAASWLLFASQARGEEPVHRIGVLAVTEETGAMQALLEGLRERGYVVGRNLQIEHRYSQGRNEQIPTLVAELVGFGLEVIVAEAPQNALAVHAAAPSVPLVFIAVADPIALGLVESLARPGGNVTGFATLVPEGFVGKQLQWLKDLVPQASRIALLINPTNPMHQLELPKFPEIGRQLGVEVIVVEASKLDQLETAFETAHTQGAEAIYVFGDPLLGIHRAKVVGLAARYRMPAIYFSQGHVRDGGLMSYGPKFFDFWRRAGAYVDKILKGERAGDLPVEQPTRLYLLVNLKTAAELGITVPPLILAQADEVIE
jgi:putative tryptophan/tyrosine transport system substrate-binding protein